MLVAQCPDRESLHAFSTGRLSSERTDEVAAHVESCSECLTELTTLADDGDSLVSELRGAVDDDFLQEPAFGAAVAEARTLLHRVRETGEQVSSPAPRVLGEYELLDELGRGGMGRVYKARHTKLDRIVAVKILPSGRLENAQAIARFEREMRAIGGLDHPHIVHAYDGREIEQMPVLVMEYIDGMDLAEVVRRLGRLKPADACELVRQAALGLQYAHTKGLVHRDIKPSNLMLTRDGVVKVLDLGLARFYAEPTGEEVTGAGQAMGTADYIAPEQVSDSRSADIRSDIYSLGCTLYKLLAGKAPYSGHGRGTFGRMNAHVSEPLPAIEHHVSGLSAQLLEVLQRMTAKHPEERFASPEEVVKALEPPCVGADTVQVIERAERVSPRAEDEPPHGDAIRQPELASATQSQRWKLCHLLITLGLMASMLGIGFAAGVMLTINKDGEETQVELPDGAHATVNASGDISVRLPDSPQSPPSLPIEATEGLSMGRMANIEASGSAAPAEDLKKMQGRWRVIAQYQRGKAQTQKPLRLVSWVFNGDLTSLKSDAPDLIAVVETPRRIYLDPSQEPKALDLQAVSPLAVRAGIRSRGIYRFRDGCLEIAIGVAHRPTDFTPGPNTDLWILQRIDPPGGVSAFLPAPTAGPTTPRRSGCFLAHRSRPRLPMLLGTYKLPPRKRTDPV